MTDTRGNQGDLIEVRLSDPLEHQFEEYRNTGEVLRQVKSSFSEMHEKEYFT